MSSGNGSGLGKLILCGEHAVVYGHEALAFAVDRATRVLLEPAATRALHAPDFGDDARLERALDAALGDLAVRVEIESDLPVGRGMGSSAALAVALVRARQALEGGAELDAAGVFERAIPIERIFHGTASGLDVAVAARGGFLAFRRGPPVQITALPVSVPWQVVVLDTEVAGDTAQLVAGVAARAEEHAAEIERIGQLVSDARDVIQDVHALGELLNENHAILYTLGVSSPAVERLVHLARAAGATGAKLSGAGGGGVVIALTEDPAPILAAAAREEVPAFATGVGGTP